MGKYEYGENNSPEYWMWKLTNEIAEANRLKRLALIKELPSTIEGPMPSIKLKDLEDQA